MTVWRAPENWREIQRAQEDKGIRKRTFTVVGPRKVQGKATGETVELEFPEAVIDVLISGGFITETVAVEAKSQDVADEEPAQPRATRARSSTRKG